MFLLSWPRDSDGSTTIAPNIIDFYLARLERLSILLPKELKDAYNVLQVL